MQSKISIAEKAYQTLCRLWQAKKHLGPKLIETAAQGGIDIRPIHMGRPLKEQGPFDILLHKIRRKGTPRRSSAEASFILYLNANDTVSRHLSSRVCCTPSCWPFTSQSSSIQGADVVLCSVTEWEEELAEYSKEHPHMRIVDSFDRIRPIMSRFSMLAPFDKDICLSVRQPR